MSLKLIQENLTNLELRCTELSILPSTQKIIISIRHQKLFLLKQERLIKQFIISTSENPPSCLENSFGTPLGLHRVEEKIGEGVPIDTVFKGRVSQGYTYQKSSKEEQLANLITTRIIRIKGLDPNLNQGDPNDTYNRFIYIHGTNHEERLGKPFSNGCVELSNQNCLELFSLVRTGDYILIA